MSKKKVLIALAVTTALTLPLSVFAATSDTQVAKSIRGFFGIDFSKLTEKQKTDAKDYGKKMADLQKDFINKMVENGSMTKEQGDAEIKRIDEAIKNGEELNFLSGFGRGRGGFSGPGMKGGLGIGKIDTSKLTDQQKADLKDSRKKIIELQKESISKLVANGLLTKEQGDAVIKKAEETAAEIESGDLTAGMGLGRDSFGFFGMYRTDASTLTEKQKTDLSEIKTKMTALHKELINKLVANGTITKEEGDAAIQRLDNMKDFDGQYGMHGKKGMKKGRFGSPGRQGNTTTTNSSITTQAAS
ncbi:MAG: YckD family protein [Clostridia bacterium]|nr:YckD family protein [Clostridia bacterium]